MTTWNCEIDDLCEIDESAKSQSSTTYFLGPLTYVSILPFTANISHVTGLFCSTLQKGSWLLYRHRTRFFLSMLWIKQFYGLAMGFLHFTKVFFPLRPNNSHVFALFSRSFQYSKKFVWPRWFSNTNVWHLELVDVSSTSGNWAKYRM